MTDFKKISKDVFKIMWLPGEDEIIFHANNESPLPLNTELYKQLNKYFDIENWKNKYAEAYKEWLNDISNVIYDIRNDINMSIIDALTALNKELEFQVIYYWFDIDRTFTDGYLWEYCPISGEKLIYLGEEYTRKNSLISPSYPIIFPYEPQ
ncbi:hypothetical protein DVR12_07595 [Chitinophaga silvatica]|uniref:Uncharacterized protein n=1 Tax=Chitinophaga silvatica TaxID=2282649 RepID=A0A3E1YEQ7_9BACT|nr:hypothetical protein [Chitinophaga silvatica]RFS25040.1 hypothetical protein DVR12_07595 [Chitinophaga silvatica]